MEGYTKKQINKNRKTENREKEKQREGVFMCGPVLSCMDMYGHGNLSSNIKYGYVKSTATAGNKGKIRYKGKKGDIKLSPKTEDAKQKKIIEKIGNMKSIRN